MTSFISIINDCTLLQNCTGVLLHDWPCGGFVYTSLTNTKVKRYAMVQ